MSFRSFRMVTLLIGMVICNRAIGAEFGPGEAAARLNSPSSNFEPEPGHADFKVLIWYRRADPLATFKYQVYDLRMGEFTPAAAAWIKSVNANYPAYTAFPRDVYLSAENGKTDALKVGSVLKRELTVAAALSGVILGSPINSVARPFESIRNSSASINRQTGSMSNDRSFLNTSPAPFPVPVPYPRPHP
jgi:hypothetical protein